jgi:hypothetical protein
MFYVPSFGIYTDLSRYADTNFHKQNSALLGLLRIWFAASAMRSRSWSSVCIYFNFLYQIFRVAPKIKIKIKIEIGYIRHRIGTRQNQPHINADIAPQKYNGTEGLLQENARPMYSRFVALELPRISL